MKTDWEQTKGQVRFPARLALMPLHFVGWVQIGEAIRERLWEAVREQEKDGY